MLFCGMGPDSLSARRDISRMPHPPPTAYRSPGQSQKELFREPRHLQDRHGCPALITIEVTHTGSNASSRVAGTPRTTVIDNNDTR
jgi:hypothetical protein